MTTKPPATGTETQPNVATRAKRGASWRLDVTRWSGREDSVHQDSVAVEEPLEIRLNGESVSVTMRSPGNDLELAAGLLYTEGIITSAEQLVDVSHQKEPTHPNLCNIVQVATAEPIDLKSRGWQRNFVSTSSCGLCGKATIASLKRHAPPLEDSLQIRAELLYELPDKLRAQQRAFTSTGGIHAAGLFTPDGELITVREDIGRHNAVDKLIGAAVLNGTVPLSHAVMMVSGRSSFEIVQKALVARIPVLAGVSAASSLAISLAEESRMTLIGFLRQETMNIYAGAQRVLAT